MFRIYSQKGISLIEVLLATILSGAVITAAMGFYMNEHNNMLAQGSITDMQQNIRACIAEVSTKLANAGAGMPDDMASILASNTNPDTLMVRQSSLGGSIKVGEHTQNKQASPIHVAKGTDLSGFHAGQSVLLYHSGTKTEEWFTITKVSINNGSGWEQIHHQGQVLLEDPMPGDMLIAGTMSKYFIDASDTAHPVLMKSMNGDTPTVFADYITDFQLQFYLTNGDTVQALTAADTARVARVAFSAKTGEIDYERERHQKDGRRYTSLATEVLVRNNSH